MFEIRIADASGEMAASTGAASRGRAEGFDAFPRATWSSHGQAREFGQGLEMGTMKNGDGLSRMLDSEYDLRICGKSPVDKDHAQGTGRYRGLGQDKPRCRPDQFGKVECWAFSAAPASMQMLQLSAGCWSTASR